MTEPERIGESGYVVKDSGERAEFDTGAVRDTAAGKGRFDLIPWNTIWALAKLYEAGCQKYGDRNWEKGIPLSCFFDSGMRHSIEEFLGYTDEDHLVAAIWNLVGWHETRSRIEKGILPDELDDIPYIEKTDKIL